MREQVIRILLAGMKMPQFDAITVDSIAGTLASVHELLDASSEVRQASA
jgi:hypothetical protein